MAFFASFSFCPSIACSVRVLVILSLLVVLFNAILGPALANRLWIPFRVMVLDKALYRLS